MKNRIWISLLLLVSLSAALRGANYYIATNGNDSWPGTSSQPWAGFDHAFTSLPGGDTLIIKDGTYHPQIAYGTALHSGTAAHYTVIMAEHDFQASFNDGNYATTFVYNSSYYQFQGIKFNTPFMFTGHHIKVFRCAFCNLTTCAGNYANVDADMQCNNILFEECYSWGCGRYKFIAFQAEKVIFRRCVSRHDYHEPNPGFGRQCATFTTYDTKDFLFENCIGINSWQDPLLYGNFWGGVWSENNADVENQGKFLGCVFLNLGKDPGNFFVGAGVEDPKNNNTNRVLKDVVVWDASGGYDGGRQDGSPQVSLEHVTFGACDYGANVGTGFVGATIRNSLLYGNTCGVKNHLQSDYNYYYQNGSNFGADYGVTAPAAGTHDRFENPGLKYICRPEANSPLQGSASDGGDIGATVLTRYGVSGTLWGEPGYDSLTREPLWPFPNEKQIKSDMSSWTGQNNAKRGFCADGKGLYGGPITLTSYIWEYLGNPCPPEIYGNTKTETVAPSPKDDPALEAIPNPLRRGAVCSFTIGGHRSVPLLLMIYNASGKRVADFRDASRHAVQWNTAGMPAGMYLAQLTAGNNRAVRRIVVTR